MAIFSKPQEGRHPEPESCHRCGARPGVAHLHMLRSPEPSAHSGADGLWLCERCRDEVQRSSPDN
jgi:hypothetical protein